MMYCANACFFIDVYFIKERLPKSEKWRLHVSISSNLKGDRAYTLPHFWRLCGVSLGDMNSRRDRLSSAKSLHQQTLEDSLPLRYQKQPRTQQQASTYRESACDFPLLCGCRSDQPYSVEHSAIT